MAGGVKRHMFSHFVQSVNKHNVMLYPSILDNLIFYTKNIKISNHAKEL